MSIEKNATKARLLQSIRLPLQFLFLLWGLHLIQLLIGQDFGFLGILPQRVEGLKGVFFAPLIHADFGHLISNSVPLFVLSAIILFFYRKVAIPTFIMIYILTGLTVWALARGSVFHIGASGVVYGLVSFVFWTGIFRRSLKAIVLALIVTFLYSGMFFGILPNQEGISWESHLLGAVVGIFTAYFYKDRIEVDEAPPVYSWEIEPEVPARPFLPPDTFEKTKLQREQEKRLREQQGGWFSDSTF
ncbi:MAG: rhomboid family intramembrane serine protease [Bacteroidota bacterium]